MPNRFSLTVVVLLAAGVWAAALAANGWKIGGSFFSPASQVVSALVVATLIFDRWAWAWWGINSIWHRPDLRGTWKGELLSNFPGAKEPIETYLSIKQTFSHVVIRLFTAKSGSVTRMAMIEQAADDIDTVIAVYGNEPKLAYRNESPMHEGAFALRVLEGDELEGKYWTDRSTQGAMKFHRVSKRRSTDFASAQSRG